MKKIVQNIASLTMIFALVISAFNMPLVSIANAQEATDFNFFDFEFPEFDFPEFDFGDGNVTVLNCQITANNTEIFVGGNVTLSWNIPGAQTVTINGQPVQGDSGSVEMSNIQSNTTYTVSASANGSSCEASVRIICVPAPVDCRLEVTKVVDKTTARVNDILTYTISVKNVGTTDCTGSGVKIEDVLSDSLTYLTQTTSNNITAGYDGGIPVYTSADRTLHFNGDVLTAGEQGTMTVTARVNTPNTCGDFEIPNQARATAFEMNNFGTWAYSQTVRTMIDNDCSADPAPSCDSFTATPSTIVVGGNAVLAWQTTNASRVVISNGIGEVAADGTVVVAPLTTTTYQLTAFGTQNRTVTCDVPVTLASSQVFSCPNNVSISASNYSIREGEDITLNWSTTNVDSLTISGVNSTALSGSTTVGPRSNTTYTLTATKNGQSINCPINITVDEDNGGGGGGGSSSPRCELTISDSTIKRGDQITLKWDTSRVTKVEIEDDNGKTVMSTEKYSSKEKDEYYDGSIKLKPTKDTTYTLVASKGSKDRTCKVKVDVDDLVVLTSRDQKPLIAGISLSNVPYTGFEAGPVLTVFFYTLLAAWALFVSYLIISRRQPVAEFMALSQSPAAQSIKQSEDVRPDAFVASVIAPAASVIAPANLPTGNLVVGYEDFTQVSDDIIATLENRAHSQNALLSSDAIRHFISTTEGNLERNDALDEVIAEAKGQYPLEDGWIVINEARMQHLCDVCNVNHVASTNAPFIPTVIPEGSSSLAEAIVTGNIVAAYEMIGNRPMFALADAAADLDAVLRNRRGETNMISDLLTKETAVLSEQTIKNMITALTGALDGTYTDEASAVKMAIMKAVKEIA